MATKITQATVTNPGASDAEDFQPPTRNPQTAPGQIFPENTNLQQPGTQETLLNSNLRISVPTHKPPARQEITEAKGSPDTLLLAVLLAVIFVGVAHWWYRRRRRVQVIEATAVASEVSDAPTPVLSDPIPVVGKKTTPRKSKSKRKKRSRR